jgi:pyrroline-5-carboxylate reductase
MSIVLIGAGNLGSALARGWLSAQHYTPSDLAILVRSDSYRRRAPELEPYVTRDPACLRAADTVVVSVKPKDVAALLPTVAEHTPREAVVVSVAAGITLAELASGLPALPLARAMPNICAAVGQAATAVTFRDDDAHRRGRVLSLFGLLGYAFETTEDQFDAITALSGSGPAYAYLILDALTTAGERLGLPAALSRLLATRTFAGAARMALHHDDVPFTQLIGQVASPGGTTEAALKRMSELCVAGGIVEGVTSAKERAGALRLKA